MYTIISYTNLWKYICQLKQSILNNCNDISNHEIKKINYFFLNDILLFSMLTWVFFLKIRKFKHFFDKTNVTFQPVTGVINNRLQNQSHFKLNVTTVILI